MTDWFEWNGVKCTEYGIHVSEHPPLTRPAERATYTNVPGRPGSLTTLEGDDVYDDMILTANCFVQNTQRVAEIGGWLRGSGRVTFANRQGGWYEARVVNQISFEQVLRGRPHRTFAVNFRCKPFWYADDVRDITVTQSLTTVTNPGNVYSEPLITLYGSGDVTLMVGTTIVELTDLSGSIALDSALMEAYSGNTLMNEHMNGDFPVLKPGSNAISWAGDVTRVEIQPRWRYL